MGKTRAVEELLTIDSVISSGVTKRELMEAIDRTFPDDKITGTSKIAVINTTKMRDGTIKQSVQFGLDLIV